MAFNSLATKQSQISQFLSNTQQISPQSRASCLRKILQCITSSGYMNGTAFLKKKDSSSMEEDGLVQIDSSDSESEGFVDGGKRTSSNGTEKASKDATKSCKKASLDSLKTSGKSSSETPATKGGKGGKGDWAKGVNTYTSGKAGGGGLPRASVVKPPIPEVELKLEMDLPKNARILMDCEAAAILQGIQESLTVLSDDPNIKMPDSFNKAFEYCKGSTNYTNTDSARQVLETLKEHGVTDGEICMIGNVCPETIDEVYALISSLRANKRKNEMPIREVLVNLTNFMRS